MTGPAAPLYESVTSLGEETGEPVTVRLSPELVRLLSEQLYQSPLKAIEELVVNAYDAEAKVCRVFVPEPATPSPYVAVFDDGVGMDTDGLTDLWWIGRTKKRDEEMAKRIGRKQIGKFGIGKLATYAIANQVTYISKAGEDIFAVTLDFGAFQSEPDTRPSEVMLPLLKITDLAKLEDTTILRAACEAIDIDPHSLTEGGPVSWTFVVLERLKPKASAIPRGRLKWVLRTAMPLRSDFRVYLNGQEIESAKTELDPIVAFQVSEIGSQRVQSIARTTDTPWRVEEDRLVSEAFPQGIWGSVVVTRSSLLGGKSEDLGRSQRLLRQSTGAPGERRGRTVWTPRVVACNLQSLPCGHSCR